MNNTKKGVDWKDDTQEQGRTNIFSSDACKIHRRTRQREPSCGMPQSKFDMFLCGTVHGLHLTEVGEQMEFLGPLSPRSSSGSDHDETAPDG